MEFMLPKSRAGPLVVPYISYETFQTSHELWNDFKIDLSMFINLNTIIQYTSKSLNPSPEK